MQVRGGQWWRRVVYCTMMLCLIGGLAPDVFGAGAIYAEAATAPTHDQAVGLLQVYFKDLNAKQYRSAYALRGAALQRKQSYASFAAGFSRTAQNTLKVSGTSASGSTTIVRCELDATLTSGAQQQFRGTYTIGRENGRFRILAANLSVVA